MLHVSTLVPTSWLISILGEPGLGHTLQRAVSSPAAETEVCPPPYNRGQSAPHITRDHGRPAHVVSASTGARLRRLLCGLPDALS